jgi:exodeoxyribonuclease V beta subunit
MKAQRTGSRGGWVGPLEDRREESAIERAFEASGELLRSARTSGIFLHELLERLPLASFDASAGIEAWRARPEVSMLVDEAMAVHRVDPAQRDHAERLVWSAYTTPANLPGGARITGFAAASRVAREMDFVYPTGTTGPAGEYVRGSLDLAFEHEGLTYFVDWKSDSLASFAPETLGEHVHAHYEEQLRLYALAVVKLLGVSSAAEYAERFGGFLYCFLRGFDAGGAGLWSMRPTFGEISAWEADLRPASGIEAAP